LIVASILARDDRSWQQCPALRRCGVLAHQVT